MTNRNEFRLPVASRIDADASAVAAGSRLDQAIEASVNPLRRNWLFALLMVVGWLAQAGLRAWFSRAQTVPLDNPDETAYLIAARFFGGRAQAANFSGSTLYRGGYPLLITPVYWFTSSPAAVYHAVLLINAAVSAHRDAARLPGLPPTRARPPGRLRRGHGRGAAARRILL